MVLLETIETAFKLRKRKNGMHVCIPSDFSVCITPFLLHISPQLDFYYCY